MTQYEMMVLKELKEIKSKLLNWKTPEPSGITVFVTILSSLAASWLTAYEYGIAQGIILWLSLVALRG